MAPGPGPLKSRLPTQIVFFTTARVVFNTMHRMVYPFINVFGRGLGVDLTQMSWALTVRSSAGALGPLLATIADSRSRKAGMLLGLLMFIGGVTLVIFWPVFWIFVLTLVLTTVGYLVFIPSMQAYLGDHVPYQQRGLAIAVTEMGWSLSFIVGVPLVGLLLDRLGWRSPFPFLLFFSLVFLVLLVRLVPGDAPPGGASADALAGLRRVVTHPLAWVAVLMSMSFCMANEMVNLVFGVWMEDSFQFKVTSLGALAVAIGLAELSGEGLVAALVDRLGKVRSIALGLLFNILAALSLAFLGRSLATAFVSLLLFYLTFEFTLVSSMPLMTEVLPAARASMLAANIAFISVSRALGDLVAPMFYRLSVQALGSPGIGLNAAAAILLDLLALSLLLILRKTQSNNEAFRR